MRYLPVYLFGALLMLVIADVISDQVLIGIGFMILVLAVVIYSTAGDLE